MFSICGKKQIEVFLLFYGDKIEIILYRPFAWLNYNKVIIRYDKIN